MSNHDIGDEFCNTCKELSEIANEVDFGKAISWHPGDDGEHAILVYDKKYYEYVLKVFPQMYENFLIWKKKNV